tara:strand:- start:285 stop:482 length:198 start_codon:yes stop_codon:yes gene_type:complete
MSEETIGVYKVIFCKYDAETGEQLESEAGEVIEFRNLKLESRIADWADEWIDDNDAGFFEEIDDK